MRRALIPRLLARGHRVLALARAGSEGRLPKGAEVVTGDALDAATYRARVARGATLVHLVGVAHVVYLSVARPSPVMKAYQATRAGARRLGLVTLEQMTAALV